jgi:multicomponent Na+:H+ antiporter subunit G
MTVDLIRHWLGGGLVLVGSLFMMVGAVGLIRMPDVFTRMHGASVSDTLGGGLILIGLIVLAGLSLVAVKLAFLILFFGLMSPVATHAIARAALHAGVRPVLAEGGGPAAKPKEGTKSKH